jgi:hypothetical protein
LTRRPTTARIRPRFVSSASTPFSKPRRVALLLWAVVLVGLPAIAALVIRPTSRDIDLIADHGLLDGWRCTHEPTYVYEPRRNWLAGDLLDESPEALIPRGDIERVEVSRQSGEAVIWVRGTRDGQRVYVLQPGRATAVTDRSQALPEPLCVLHLGGWQIVGEHLLGKVDSRS